MARDNGADPGSSRSELQRLGHEPGRRCQRDVQRAGHRRASSRGRRRQAPAARIRRGLRDHRLVQTGETTDAARHQAGGRDAWSESPGPWKTGASSVLRRRGPAHPARSGRHPGHGSLPGRPAPLPGEPRGHAYSHTGRGQRFRSTRSPLSNRVEASRRSSGSTATGRSM